MSYLIDTNAISGLRRKNPDAQVVNWFAQRPATTMYLSVLTLGECRKGIETLSEPQRKLALLDWLEVDLISFFSGRILHIDEQVADRWGKMVAAAGRPLPAIDSLIAATAARHGMALVTRNCKDFAGLGIDVINPWQA